MSSEKKSESRTLGSRIAIALSLVALFAALGGGAYAASQIGSKDIKKNAVKSKQIKAGAVKNAELADGSVTSGKLAGGAVDAGKLADGSVGGAKLADGSVGTGKLADGSVTGAKAGAGVLRDMIIVEDREPNSGETTGATKQAFATCPEGYVATGGGGRILGDERLDAGDTEKEVIIDTNGPIVAEGPGLRQWFVEAEIITNGGTEDYAVVATAICVKA